MAVQDAATISRTYQNYLFGPVSDFLMLGGGALVVLPLLVLVPERSEGLLAVTMLLLTNLINHPHFAHSYQIFYRNFRKKVCGDGYDRNLQYRYVFAGIVVPIIMAGFFAYSVGTQSARMLGYAANVLSFFVGWHYVKQGYGILMVDSVLKRLFFKNHEKKVFIANGYAVWLFSWMQINATITEKHYLGLNYYTFEIPGWLSNIGLVAAAASTTATLVVLFDRWQKNGGVLPYNGVMAYLVTLYIWILLAEFNPLWLLVVPALHSLQYLAVVWRFQTNIEVARKGATDEPKLRMLSRLGPMWRLRLFHFILLGGLIGFLGFWGAPLLLEALVTYNKEVLGSALFIFMFWIFINIHHYFLDNVMWRRGNPDVSTHLFR
jgi:hypothetical protein